MEERRGARRPAGSSGSIPPFHSFLEEHRTPVYRFLLAAAGPSDADDCFQETFLAALRAYSRLANGDNLRGWVMAIASRKAIDFGRARARRPVPVADVPDRAGVEPDAPGDMPDVWEAVRRLPPRQAVAVAHRVVLDQPYEAVAEAMGGSVEAARANVYQGLKRLREEVKLR
jgi:RNA polymerase sigma factor (sigma-70 family)